MENITFCSEMPNFEENSLIYYFVTFKISGSEIAKEISNINIILFSRLDYEETVNLMKDKSNSEKFDVYVKSILEKTEIPFDNAKWTVQYMGISADNLLKCKIIDYEKECK